MDKLEKAEQIRQKTGVSYEDARAALDACGEDVLDALVWLEAHGKTAAKPASFTAEAEPADPISAEMSQAQHDYEKSTKSDTFARTMDRIGDWFRHVAEKGLKSSFVCERHGSRLFSIPVLLLALIYLLPLVTFAFPLLLVLIVLPFVGMAFGFRYHFEGAGSAIENINSVVDRATEGVESLKREVREGAEAARKDSDEK